jgi:hypothetical protein
MKSESIDLPEELNDVYGNSVLVCHIEGNLYTIYPDKNAYINHRKDKVIETEYFIVSRDKLPMIRSARNKNYKLLKDKYLYP